MTEHRISKCFDGIEPGGDDPYISGEYDVFINGSSTPSWRFWFETMPTTIFDFEQRHRLRFNEEGQVIVEGAHPLTDESQARALLAVHYLLILTCARDAWVEGAPMQDRGELHINTP